MEYPDLPIVAHREDILDLLGRHQVLVVAGETGSGKTTQLPKMCLEAGRTRIGHTQPRRIAARSVAERIAEEMGVELGSTVGYAVRFTDRVSPETQVKVMTDGILLAELHRDRLLEKYDTIIVDEAHERSLNIDFLLGYLTQLLPRRPDLRVIVTSATIDTARFAAHFGDAPIIEVSGRSYPVEIRYDPIGDDRDQVQAVADAVASLPTSWDVLVFLSGEREIRDTAEVLKDEDVLPLYARLSAAEQHRVFAAHRRRRIVLATNIAETSLTVPGIRAVVDAGTARISRFNRRTKVQRLPIEAISQASANQRAGRCGRVAPGVCIRLYSEDDFAARPEFTEPEVQRTNLASVILQMAALELGPIEEFPFLDPPDIRSVKDGIALLEELGALSPAGRLTRIGRQLTRLPVDPRLGRMLIEAQRVGTLAEVLVIAAGLSIQDPRERPLEKRAEADAAHARFTDPGSDFMSMLNLWDHLHQPGTHLRRVCRTEFLHYLRVREWQDLHEQLRRLFPRTERAAERDPKGIHTACLAGLLSHVGMLTPVGDYQGARGTRFAIARGSAGKSRKWVMAAELVETNRTWARMVAGIDPSTIERLADHLVKRSYGEPRWSVARRRAVADERVTLYGLPLVSDRQIDYARIDRAVARTMFIEHALVDRPHHALDELHDLEARARRSLAGMSLFDFYDSRMPPDAVSASIVEPTVADLLGPDAPSLDDFPDAVDGFRVSYTFDPGAPDDGVAVDVPLVLLPSFPGLEWHVPGWRLELVSALIRSLPRAFRRSFDEPAAALAAAFLETAAVERPLLPQLAAFLGYDGPWDLDALPPHLRIRYRVVSGNAVLGTDVVLDNLRRRFRPAVRDAIEAATRFTPVAGLTKWPDIPLDPVRGTWHGHDVVGYPALVDLTSSVGVRVCATRAEQRVTMELGTARLLALVISGEVDEARMTAIDQLMQQAGGPAYDAAGFETLCTQVRGSLKSTAEAVRTFARLITATARTVRTRLDHTRAPVFQDAVDDMRTQLDALVYPGFVRATGASKLPDVLRYVRGIEKRLDKLPEDPERDAQRMRQVQSLASDRADVRWMLEELRISLFAQSLGTAGPISPERVRRAIGSP